MLSRCQTVDKCALWDCILKTEILFPRANLIVSLQRNVLAWIPMLLLSSAEPSYQIGYTLTRINLSWQALLMSLSSVASIRVSLISAHRSTSTLVLIKEPFLKFLLFPSPPRTFLPKWFCPVVDLNHNECIKVLHVRASAKGDWWGWQASTISAI